MACIITDGDLNIVSEEFHAIVHHPKEVLDNMNEWCIQNHGQVISYSKEDRSVLKRKVVQSGLTQKVLESHISLEKAHQDLFRFIQKYVPGQRVGMLAGNSVHVDRQFLMKDFPLVTEHLHYRIVDVSTVKELTRRWFPQSFSNVPMKRLTHR